MVSIEESMRARIRELVKKYGSHAGAAKALGVSQQALTRVLHAHTKPGKDFVEKIAKHDRATGRAILRLVP